MREDRLRRIIAETLGVEIRDVTDDAEFDGDLGMDSLDRVELITAVENEFEVVVSDEEAEKLKTAGQLIKYLEVLEKEKNNV